MDIEKKSGIIYYTLSPEEFKVLQEDEVGKGFEHDFWPVKEGGDIYFRVGYTEHAPAQNEFDNFAKTQEWK
ncbi:hypothetical protein A3D05_03205 [Candidatus Gottesmanbacteria bacterium RIFCSPHIGHO2_02_FULL_40_24]|uniref:Uncharacterized protein n=1 Tax=Candidatus Gottesmanbacteria bacterium RIFCSPHIGHO2_01_FULL_40_15 TaxID=1798376 RepID=A0A1F5Z0L6_9BACT|nr:MAG: hypothetical protein A2777_04785 [Candidatus Gottesmanbacteria bacterium RIFCSPHIGHO2_01_FULL_40_15]OGG17700.1 MAG: hypothetical protein A3D05_03205 [Candidatus Gottesmanbacteria bacterium RIFCSPHIGHO2_02_FULL_40_24]OGG21615.1 MAG: hypothetical protein A3B48_04880 [Candidatus Gottesmanbacteria bacterium RIFCSPLOWO2_01_FULL_40_10]OGG24807.1 MAG: hypothetical protein A3E42_02435 [Candidatus Gottesmanbacteria bacterium RIFCSPHIGHO2_12_FULL_40_13]OGG33088.1 MAG: hypothetical protein A3I80_0